MGSQKQPEIVHPGEAAKAAMGTAGAGEMMAIANQPIEQYSNLRTNVLLGPAQIRAQQALGAQAALQSAKAQKDIQAQVDPYAFAQRELRLKSAANQLARLYGESMPSYSASDVYTMPASGSVPSLSELRTGASDIASNLSMGAINSSGGDPRLVKPRNPQDKLTGYF
jgi:hypothetical protein